MHKVIFYREYSYRKIISFQSIAMRIKLLKILLLFISLSANAQKELWGVNSGDEYFVPSSYFGNITKYDINGENPVIIHEFDSIHGAIPKGKLLLASNGKLYGTTIKGGTPGPLGSNSTAGVLFEYDLVVEHYRVIHYFQYNPTSNSTNPDIGVIEPVPGLLIGATYNQIFKYDIANESIVFSNPLLYNNSIHGGLMKASDGNIYGTSYYGNCSGPIQPLLGNIIKYNIATNNVSFVHSIYCDYDNGAFPNTAMIEVSPGKLLGTTLAGGTDIPGASNLSNGTIFEFNINTNVFTKKIDFTYLINGAHPRDLVMGENGKVYGLCEAGGVPQTCNNPNYNFGTLYEYTPATNLLEVKQNFSYCENIVKYPTSLIKTSLGDFIGTIPNGGTFKWDSETNTIIMPGGAGAGINAYNNSSLIEICRKPSYHFFDTDSFDSCEGSNFSYDIQNTNATSYQWIKDDENIPAQTSSVLNLTGLTAADSGSYACLMTNECGTTTTMPLHLTVSCLGTEAIELNKIKLYPNPASDQINIELPQNIDITGCSINNLLGQTVLKTKMTNKLDVSSLQKGVYIVSLQTEYGIWNGKFVKQ